MILTQKEIIKYLRHNRYLLDIKSIAEKAGIDQSTLHKAINGTIMKGCVNPIKIQDKYLPSLSKVILGLTFKRRKDEHQETND